MAPAKAENEKKRGKNDEQPTIDSVFLRTGTINNRRKAPMALLLITMVSAGLPLSSRQSPWFLSAAADAATATPRSTFTNAANRRRCIGRFLADYATTSDVDTGGEEHGSVLNWLNENTSCDLPPEPSVPSKKRKNKDPNHMNDETEIMSMAASFDREGNPYHVVMLLMEDHPIRHEIVTLSSGFLAAGLEVTIFYISYNGDSMDTNDKNQTIADSIQSDIFQRMPPNENVIQRARDSFRCVELNLNKYTSKNKAGDKDLKTFGACKKNFDAAHPLDKCAIEMAPTVLKLLRYETSIHIPPQTRGNDTKRFDFVLMMDAGFLGGLLFSEIEMIPSIVIGSHHTLMFAIEQETNWSPSPNRMTLDRMDRIFLQRLYSFGLTGVFIRANRMRQSLGLTQLQRLKSPLDHILPVVAVLADLVPSDYPLVRLASSHSSAEGRPMNTPIDQREIYGAEDDRQGFGYRVHNLQPLLSPCNLCLDEITPRMIENNSTVIMVAPPANVSAKWIRSLIRALSITKHSLEGYDDCLFDRATCRNGVVGFEVDWLSMSEEDDDHFPPVIPSFIHREESVSVLDSAIRNPNTMIALIHCDSGSNILATFGIEVYCISQSDRIPTIYSVGDLLEEKGYEGAAKSRGYPATLLENSINRENISPEEVATQLLNVLRRQSVGSEAASMAERVDSMENRNKEVAEWITSGLQRALTIVQSAARVHRETIWEDPRQMQQVTSSAIANGLHSMDFISGINHVNNRQDMATKQGIYDLFSVFVAWVVFLSAAIYIILKDSVAMKRWRQHRLHLYYRNGGTIIDSILNRLNDLDNTWDMILSWSSGLSTPNASLDTHGDRIGRLRTNENTISNARKEHQQQNNYNNNHHYGQVRRRRKKTTR